MKQMPLTSEQVAKAHRSRNCSRGRFCKDVNGLFSRRRENKGATIEIIKVMMDAAKGRCKIKGSGAIRTRKHFLELIDYGN